MGECWVLGVGFWVLGVLSTGVLTLVDKKNTNNKINDNKKHPTPCLNCLSGCFLKQITRTDCCRNGFLWQLRWGGGPMCG